MMKNTNLLPVMVAIVLIVSVVLSYTPISASDADTSAEVRNAAPTVALDLAPDNDPGTPGVQVINQNPSTNITVTITASVTDMNGWDDLTGVVIATITGPSVVHPVNLGFDSVVNVTTARYRGSFNLSSHSEGDYNVEVTAIDTGGLTGVGSKNCTYSYGVPPDTTPPTVTNPSANPDIIGADGIQESQLNVTVTDVSGIRTVTVDLTDLGGPATDLVTNIPGTDVYTTSTTAVAGTLPGTYHLPVNATDNSPSRKSNTLVSIPLTVRQSEVVTTYDFTTGAGTDKWAFRKQHKAKPPATSDVPRIEFGPVQYNRIKAKDWSMQIERTSRKKKHAIHRFKFDIAELESDITKIEVAWNGFEFSIGHTNGATLYIWNSATGKYVKLDKSERPLMWLNGEITANVGDYIDADGNLIIIAEQNSRHVSNWWWEYPSYIGTDYVKVDVTYIPSGGDGVL